MKSIQRSPLILLLVAIATNCASTNSAEQAVAALSEERAAIYDLGTRHAVNTSRTQRVLEYGGAAVPALVRAIESGSRVPWRAAYAAYCLRTLKSKAGTQAAAAVFQRLNARREELTSDERFVWNEFRLYLEVVSVKQDP